MKTSEHKALLFSRENLDRLLAAATGSISVEGFEGQTTINWAFFCALLNHQSVFSDGREKKRNDFALFKTVLDRELGRAPDIILHPNKAQAWFIQLQSNIVYVLILNWDKNGSGTQAELLVRRLDDTSLDAQQWRRLWSRKVEKSKTAVRKRRPEPAMRQASFYELDQE